MIFPKNCYHQIVWKWINCRWMARFRILDQTWHSHGQFRIRHVIHVHWTENGPEWRRCFVGINFLRGNNGRDPFNQNSDRSNREKRTTSKGGPVFSKLFRLDRTNPLSFGPKFPEILVEWIAPNHIAGPKSPKYIFTERLAISLTYSSFGFKLGIFATYNSE